LGTILCGIIVFRADSDYTFEQSNEALGGTITAAIVLSIVVLLLIALMMVGFGIGHLVENFKRSKGTLLGLLGFFVVLFISWAASGDEVLRAYGQDITPSVSQWIEAGLIMTLVISALLLILIFVGEIRRLLS